MGVPPPGYYLTGTNTNSTLTEPSKLRFSFDKNKAKETLTLPPVGGRGEEPYVLHDYFVVSFREN